LVFDGEDVGGPQVSVNQAFAVEKSESVQRGSKNVARFGGSERALPKKLREIFLGVFHQEVEQIEIAETAAAGIEIAQQVRVGKFGGVLPARQLELRVGFFHLDELDGNFLRRSAALGQEDGAVLGAAKITLQQESGSDDLPFPLLPRFGHSAPPRPLRLVIIVLPRRRRWFLNWSTGRRVVKSAKAESGAKASGTTDEGVAAQVEAKEAVRGAGDANALALAEEEGERGTARASHCAEPERAGGAEVCGLEGVVNTQSGGEAPGTAGKVEQARGLALTHHLLDSLQRLQGADEYAAADSGGLRADVEHEVIAVAKIDVGVANAEKHGAIAQGGAAKVVGGGVARRVGFGFDNTAAKAHTGEFADNDFADEKAGQSHGVQGKFGTAEAANGNESLAGCHGWQARQSSTAGESLIVLRAAP